MKLKKFVPLSILFALAALVGGCRYDGDHRDYGDNRYGSYREGYRDGRSAERRRDAWREGRYNDRGDQWRRRW